MFGSPFCDGRRPPAVPGSEGQSQLLIVADHTVNAVAPLTAFPLLARCHHIPNSQVPPNVGNTTARYLVANPPGFKVWGRVLPAATLGGTASQGRKNQGFSPSSSVDINDQKRQRE